MKNLLLLAVTVVSLCSACQKELKYSCDKKADDWVKSNLTTIQEMDRPGFLAVSDTYQRAAFRAFSPAQRRTLWRQKLEETLTLNWSEAERMHIEAMLVIFDKYKNMFTEEFPEKDAFLVEAYKWKKQAVETFGWDNKVIRGIIGNPNILGNTKGELLVIKNIPHQTGTGKEPRMVDCDCKGNLGEGIIIDDCAEPGCFETTSCKESSFGCGGFWVEKCDGKCWIPKQD